MEATFSRNMAATGDRLYSARIAGYSAPHQAASQNLRNADVAEDIRRRSRHRLMTEGAEVSVRVLIEIAVDTKQKASSRVAAAGKLGQMSGIASAAALSEADLADMPADKIRALLGEAERALAERMARLKTIEHEPAAAPESIDSAQGAPNLFD
jgi:hypothetical protein